MKFNKFVPLTKMEEQSDGTLHVFGTVTAEQPDLENEVCDYEKTKPFYQAKVDSMFKLTSAVSGMTPSIMPMREMHQLKAIGAGRSIEFDDAAKKISMGFHVIDPDAVAKFKAGVLIGFSQGGAYVGEMVSDPVHKGCKRYVADPAEVSGVDSPCLPSALVESMKGRTVTLTKSTGSEEIPLQIGTVDQNKLAKMEREINYLTELIKSKTTKTVDGEELHASDFAHIGDAQDTSTWSVPIKTKAQVQTALAKFEENKQARNKIMAAAKTHGIEIADRDKLAIARACATISLSKGLYEVGWLGDLLESLNWLCLQTEFERDMEDDGSKVPEGLREAWKQLIAEFKAMAIEEADELAAQGGKGAKAMKITTSEEFAKAAKTIHDHLSNLAEGHKKMAEKSADMHEKHGEMIEKCMKAAKDAMEGDEPEKAASVDMTKATEEKFAALEKSLAELTEKLSKTAAPVAAHTGSVAVNKTASAFESLIAPTVTH